MPEEIKAIVRKLLAERSREGTWRAVECHGVIEQVGDEEDFDKLFEWLKAEAEKEG